METCKRYRDALYAEAPIPGLAEHLIECEGCRELAGRLEEVDRLLAAEIPPPPYDLLDRILLEFRFRAILKELGF